MEHTEKSGDFCPEELLRNQQAIAALADSEDARQLMELLRRQGGQVRQAAQAAAQGSPQQLMEMMGRLMDSREGADLVERIEAQAKKAGL